MAVDLPTIAKSYYGGTVEPYPSTLTNREMKGWVTHMRNGRRN